MKVYVVEVSYDYEYHGVGGVYTTKEKAEEVAEKYRNKDYVYGSVSVTEHTLDESF